MSRNLGVAATFLILAATAALAAPAVLDLPPGAQGAAKVIERGALEGPVRFLADDLLEGRAPSHRGDVLARNYVASVMELLGLQPGASGGGWEQRFEIVGITTHAPETWAFRARGKELALRFWDEFIAASGSRPRKCLSRRRRARVRRLRHPGARVRVGRLQGGRPEGQDPRRHEQRPRLGPCAVRREAPPVLRAVELQVRERSRAGAAGRSSSTPRRPPRTAGRWSRTPGPVSSSSFRTRARPGSRCGRGPPRRPPASCWRSPGSISTRWSPQAHRREFEPIPLGIRTSLTLVNAISHGETANVLGMLPGGDPVLKDQVVVFSAHHDHLGIGKPDATGDVIYNGARDNATGVAQVLAIAKAFMALPQRPRRTILFAIVTLRGVRAAGLGLLRRPPHVPDRAASPPTSTSTAATSSGSTRDVALVGKGKSTLDQVAEAVAAHAQGRVVTDEPFPDRGYYYRSDHFSFAGPVCPRLYFKGGLDFVGPRAAGGAKKVTEEWGNTHYHQPSDEYGPSWDFDGMVEDAQLGLPRGPRGGPGRCDASWLPGDEFGRLREPRPRRSPSKHRACNRTPRRFRVGSGHHASVGRKKRGGEG